MPRSRKSTWLSKVSHWLENGTFIWPIRTWNDSRAPMSTKALRMYGLSSSAAWMRMAMNS